MNLLITDESIRRLVDQIVAHQGTTILPVHWKRPEIVLPRIRNHSFAQGDFIQCDGRTLKIIMDDLLRPRSVPGRLEWLRREAPPQNIFR